MTELENTQDMPPVTEEVVSAKYAPEEPAPEAQLEDLNLVQQFRATGFKDVNLLDQAIENRRGDLTKYRDAIDAEVESMPDDQRSHRLYEFKTTYQEDRVLNMQLLNEAVANNDLHGAALTHRSALRKILKAVPQR